jgi:hypothetical protein
MYLPEAQADPEGAELVARPRVPPDALASSLMRTLRAYNPQPPAAEFRPIQSVVDHAVSPRRFFVLPIGFSPGWACCWPRASHSRSLRSDSMNAECIRAPYIRSSKNPLRSLATRRHCGSPRRGKMGNASI